jgi:hypothetical protein
MIYSTVCAHRLVHFEFSLNDNEFYHSAQQPWAATSGAILSSSVGALSAPAPATVNKRKTPTAIERCMAAISVQTSLHKSPADRPARSDLRRAPQHLVRSTKRASLSRYGGVGNATRIAAIGRQTLVFRRLARCRSLGRRIGSVRRERIGRVARLGREWRRRIHVDAFTIDPVGPWVRGLRGCGAAADEQRCNNEIRGPHRGRSFVFAPAQKTQGKERSSRTSEAAAARLFVPTCMPQSQTDAIAHGRGAAWPFAGVKPRESSKTPKDGER